ncbi:MAG: LPS assembly protein LptD [Planctomycetes bacterium]|nr:LPS assembly protein LptD [Planctomycetota bacterium]
MEAMRKRFICLLLALVFCAPGISAFDEQKAQFFGAEDLHLRGGAMTTYQIGGGQHILVFRDGFDLVLGDNRLKSQQAVVWLVQNVVEYSGVTSVDYKATVYLQDKVSIDAGAGAKTSGMDVDKPVIEGAESLVAEFRISGEIFATADSRTEEDPRSSLIYRNGLVATGQIKLAPSRPEETVVAQQQKQIEMDESPNILEKVFGRDKTSQQVQTPGISAVTGAPLAPAPKFQYPVNISSATEAPVKVTNETLPDDTSIATILNRFYLWQKQDETGRLLEFQADSAVIFYTRRTADKKEDTDILPASTVKAAYFRGGVVMTEGNRTIRADEVYYDFQTKQALAVNTVMRTFDPVRGIPIYVKAAKLRQVAEHKFAGKDVTVTNSEFYVPKISATASEVYIVDRSAIDQQAGMFGNQSYDIMMKNVKLKLDNRPVFYWPILRGNFEVPDLPLKRVQFSRDNTFGTAVESEWYLAKVLGLREPKGVDSTLAIDTYSKRGTGVGADISYTRDSYFGNINGYIINDKGKDDLGRNRRNIEPEEGLRGMFNFQHRHFLPYHWQLTLKTSYLSDENYLESFHRQEYFGGRGQETTMHLKWLKDNRAFAILGKFRINDFADQLEELPTMQYHLTGQSLFNDKFTFYSDSIAGKYRQRIGKDHNLNISTDNFTFGSTRAELDMPLKFTKGNIVPFIAGTFGYDDRSGFNRNSAIGAGTQVGEKEVFIGQAGIRASTQYWKHFDVHSKFWDVNGIRHIVKPYLNASVFAESAKEVEQRDVFSFGILNRWQTKRGAGEKSRILDWMRLNLEYTMVSDESEMKRADKVLWNNSFAPLSDILAPDIFFGDLTGYRTFETFGPQRDSFNADYIWRLSDTTAILSDLNYDTKDREIEQFNIGLSQLVWPNLSYYIGTRYMRSIEIDGEKGSNAFTFAATYRLNPRYTISFAHQYDFKRDGTITTQVSLFRRYHRLYYGLTYSVDESLDRRSIVFSIWPEGIGELGFGSRTLIGLETPKERNY